jgi:hypothetical protein
MTPSDPEAPRVAFLVLDVLQSDRLDRTYMAEQARALGISDLLERALLS